MEKHLFRRVSQSSSNTLVRYDRIRRKMKQKTLLVMPVLIIFAWMIGLTWAQPTLEVSHTIVKPGEKVVISGQSTAGTILTIEINNSRNLVDSFNVTVDSTGQYRLEYLLPFDSPIDIYNVQVASIGDSFIVSRMSQQQLVNTLRYLVENAKKQAESAFIQARKQGFSIPPEIWDKYIQGLNLIDEARKSIQNQDYTDAQENLQKAINKFREIVEYSYGDNLVPPVNPKQDQLRVQELIDQLRRQYNEINTVVKKLTHYGINVGTLEQDLSILQNNIEKAQILLNDGNTNEAHNVATRTQELVKQRLIILHQKQTEITKKLAQRYQTSLENRVTTYIDTFQKLQTIRPVQSELALKELETLQMRLTQSKELLESGNVPNALREMRGTEHRLSRLSEAVNGAFTSRLLNRLDELTANLQEATGIEASEIEEKIDETKNSLTDYLRDKQPSSSSSNSSLTP